MGERWYLVLEQRLIILILVPWRWGLRSGGAPLLTSGDMGGFGWVRRGRLLGCCGFFFSLSCGIVSVVLYLGASGAGDLGDGASILLGLLALGWDVSGAVWRIKVRLVFFVFFFT